MSDPVDPVALAALNNAVRCSILAATHGVEATFGPDACTWPARTPMGYPDAVTLGRGVDVDSLLERIDVTSGCSIKDSFADLDLTPWGFEPLFDASWIHRPAERSRPRPGPPTSTELWRVVRDAAGLEAWEAAWGDSDPGTRTFVPGLLDREDVSILAIPTTGGAMGTAVLSLGGGVVGLSNVVAGSGDPAATISIAVDAAATLFPGFDIVGYEDGAMFDAAGDCGFDVIGGLRVWMSP
jgi:hypothetical protein